MAEKLVFSVSGLSVRGFFAHIDEWVPERGQRLQCHFPGPKEPIKVLLAEKSVGYVCAEAPNGFKDWLSKGKGRMEAVVEDHPKRHRSKGEEVPVIYVLTGEKNIHLMNIKREIEMDVNKKQKKKKSLKIEDGDVSRSVIRNLVSDGLKDENEIDFSIKGMHVRGFHVHIVDWFPEIGQRCCCSISQGKSVEVSFEGTTVGNVEKDGQKLFRKFLEANGDIIAVVSGYPKKHQTKGKEVPVIYVLTAEVWTNKLRNIKNEIQNDVEKRSKKKKSLKFIPGDATLNLKTENSDNKKENSDNQMESSDSHLHAGTSRNTKRAKAILKEQTPVATDGSGEGITETKVQSNKIIYSRKRRSDESIDTVAKKPALSEQVRSEEVNVYQAGSVLQIEPNDDKIVLKEKDFSRMSQEIGNNFTLLGLELGVKSAKIDQIRIAYPSEVTSQICMMLKEWKKIEGRKATLRRFLEAMTHCTKVNFEQPQFNKILFDIRKRYASEGGRTSSGTNGVKTE